jgi:POT family proton-dependent oligopeptide transporter
LRRHERRFHERLTEMTTAVAATPDIGQAQAREHHPKALPTLFFTEMWERFSYYGMRALLVLYLVNAVGYQRSDALALYATYTGLVYLTPILGGYIADRYLGTRKAILVGAVTMAMGHFAMAFPALLHLALGLLIIGNGFFKPNIATLLGTLYREGDARRDGGFTIFYMGVNLGAFISPLVAGTLGEKIGWHYGFASAGVGMVIGLLVFMHGQHKLGVAGLPAGQETLNRRDWIHIAAISALTIPLVYLVLALWGWAGGYWSALSFAGKVGVIVAVVAAAWLLQRSRSGQSDPENAPLTREEWERIASITILAFFVIFFWMGFEQAGGTMNLFADKQTDRMLFGWEMPASYFQSVNPLAIFLFAPFFSMMWTRLNESRYALSTPMKMAIGILIMSASFVVLAIGQQRADELGKVGMSWLVIVYVMQTMGELCLSPVGLSMVSKLAPAKLASLLMGTWFLANAAANYLAGILEDLLKTTGFPLYWFLVGSSLGAGVLLLLLTPVLKRMTHGRA